MYSPVSFYRCVVVVCPLVFAVIVLTKHWSLSRFSVDIIFYIQCICVIPFLFAASIALKKMVRKKHSGMNVKEMER